MALEALLAALEHEADAKAEAILAAARAEAESISAKTEAEIARRRRDALEVAGNTARVDANARLAQLRHAVRGEIMHARAAMLERVFDRARDLFPAAACDPAFRAALPRHLEEALAFAGEGEGVTLRCRPEMRPVLQALIDGRSALMLVEDASVGHGVFAQTQASGLEVDNTLEARLLRARQSLAIDLVRAIERGA